ncbi:hypothetical protein AQUCO_01300253v1 [Aquilegia coerulea]|uniref:EGF-like domain-containing protein n=1 Tax=Aquilegia coerulea TaxID=218851 RepID=A0A2G5E0N2_AQUCA|nr:hypothetical protein AQUCO_01300253v1 [Aquilegia coerulea]
MNFPWFVSCAAHQLVEQCYPLQENIMLTLTNEQISSGVWYIGVFNGIGSARTDKAMINQRSVFSFSVNVSVEGCRISGLWGQYCNQTVLPLSCPGSDIYMNVKDHSDASTYNQRIEKVTTCRNSFEASCVEYRALRGYYMDLNGVVEQLKIMTVKTTLSERRSGNNTMSGILYARYGAMPSSSLHDYAINARKTPLVIQSPKVGRWYFSFLPAKQAKVQGATDQKGTLVNICYSLDSQIRECPTGKAGPNCAWESYMLQPMIGGSPYAGSYYWSTGESTTFFLEPLLSNSSGEDKLEYAWTYFLVDIPRGAAVGHIHVQLNSDSNVDYEIYSRFGGLPSVDTWDFYYANNTMDTNGSVLFKLYDSSETAVSFFILHAKEGLWSFGLRHSVLARRYGHRTLMSLSNECSSHGRCNSSMVAIREVIPYSYCSCDLDHGGFDCSIEMLSQRGGIIHGTAVIVSSGAAILPAFWTFRQKAFIDSLLFTFSGISSGFYHACDGHIWCALSHSDLQFMDFWLSFVVVLCTCVYLANIDEDWKVVLLFVVTIVTALMAKVEPTRSSNIVLVIAIGAVILVIGGLKHLITIRPINCGDTDRCQNTKDNFYNLIKMLHGGFHCRYLLVGFVMLLLAALSWKLQTAETYWIRHSVWHVTIYTSSFFFLLSKVTSVGNSSSQEPRMLPMSG